MGLLTNTGRNGCERVWHMVGDGGLLRPDAFMEALSEVVWFDGHLQLDARRLQLDARLLSTKASNLIQALLRRLPLMLCCQMKFYISTRAVK